MLRTSSLVGCLLVVSAIVACGGPPPSGAKTGGASDPETKGLAEYIASQGGVPALGGVPGGQPAQSPDGLRFDLLDKEKPVKLDGVLAEWPARSSARRVIQGRAGNAALTIALQYDATKIFLGAEVTDGKLARTARFGDAEDHVSLTIAFPHGGTLVPYEIGFFVGKPGESSGSVRYLSGAQKGQEVPGAKIVEAPIENGYSFEAALPWTTFHESRMVRVGLHGAARYYDADTPGTILTILATGAGDVATPATLPALPTESELAMIEQLLVPKGLLGEVPKFDSLADVGGDAMKERIAVFGRYLTITGSSYLGGTKFFFRDLGGDPLKIDLRDATGRGKDDILIRRRMSSGAGSREFFEVLSVLAADEVEVTFAHEIAVVSGPKRVVNAVHVAQKEIEVSVEPAAGWDASSYREPIATDVEPVLLPWGAVRSRVFRFDGTKFAKSKETAQAAQGGQTPGGERRPTPVTRLPVDPPTPPVHAAPRDLSKQLFEQYRRDRSVAEGVKPKVDLAVNVGGDARPERVILIGRDVVVFGPGFRGGNQYSFLTLAQFEGPADIRELTAREVTGDGAAELIVRGAKRVAPTSGDVVEVDVLFVYEVRGDTITRIFSIETGREQGGKRAQGLVQFIPARGGKGLDVDVQPGRVSGWTEKSYPWPQEQPGSGPLEPLLLPWGGIPSLRYSYDGSRFVK